MSAADLVDSLAPGRVLVFGSPPPGGRDLDLLARPDDLAAVAAGLEREGFVRDGVEHVRFHDCTVDAVDLVPAEDWGLPPDALEELFAAARPIDGYAHLVRPAPTHALLIAARRFDRGRGVLAGKLRARVDGILEEDPDAWEPARSAAGAWNAGPALAGLEAAYRGEATQRRRLPRRLPRTPVVALSGIDGAGKSSQAEALVATLERLGLDAVPVWSPLGGHPLQRLVGYPAKLVLRRLRGRRGAAEPVALHDFSVMSGPDVDASRARTAWAVFGALLNALSQRVAVLRHPGRVVVCDRQALDTIVRMRFLYGTDAAWRLVRLLAPTPRFAYYLDIRAETSLARKDDIWSLDELERHVALYREELERHGVRRLDGEQPRELLCAEIAAEVWRGLSRA